jgi:hypothetical protein
MNEDHEKYNKESRYIYDEDEDFDVIDEGEFYDEDEDLPIIDW